MDFVCNRGQDRIYIQSAYALLSEEKTEQELRSLKQIKDSFLKVVIVGGMQPTFRNDDGILILNIFDFLLNRGGQNLWPSKEGFDIVIGNPPYIEAMPKPSTNTRNRQAPCENDCTYRYYQAHRIHIPSSGIQTMNRQVACWLSDIRTSLCLVQFHGLL